MAVPFIRIFGDKEVMLGINRGVRLARDMKPALELVADDVMRVIRATFMSQGRRYGGSWAHLDPDTIREKVKHGQDPRILIATEALMNSWSRRGPNQRLRVTGSYIELDSKLAYGDVHQEGDEERGLPARPFIAFDPRDEIRWAKIAERQLLKAMGLGV